MYIEVDNFDNLGVDNFDNLAVGNFDNLAVADSDNLAVGNFDNLVDSYYHYNFADIVLGCCVVVVSEQSLISPFFFDYQVVVREILADLEPISSNPELNILDLILRD